jgi:parallel beta-helix repeat protein
MTFISLAASRRRRGLVAFAGAAALAAGAFATAAPHASAATLSCGATITKSTKLTKDLTSCPGVGIKIGAAGITLDLNGHTVAAAAKRNPTAHGILNVGHDRVTIKGGTVKGFGAYGVRLAGVNGNVVNDLRMTGNFTGIGLVESSHNVVERSVMSGSRFVGVNLTGGTDNRVAHNEIADSVGPGVLVQTSLADHGSHNRVLDNAIEGNGIQVNPGQIAATLARNTIRHSAGDGIVAYEPSTILQGNSAGDGRGYGISAPNGAVDRGANVAAGNGMQPQCVGVACAS